MRILLVSLLAFAPGFVFAQEHGDHSDLAIVGRVKTEAFENSQVMETLEYLTDRYGPRLTVSPEWREAADWTVKRLQGYGLEKVHLEKWGTPHLPFGRRYTTTEAGQGFTAKFCSERVTLPRYR